MVEGVIGGIGGSGLWVDKSAEMTLGKSIEAWIEVERLKADESAESGLGKFAEAWMEEDGLSKGRIGLGELSELGTWGREEVGLEIGKSNKEADGWANYTYRNNSSYFNFKTWKCTMCSFIQFQSNFRESINQNFIM